MTLIKFKRPEAALTRAFHFPSVFDDLFDQFGRGEELNWIPAVNIKERTGDFSIDLAVPGLKKEDFKIEVENGILSVSGERKEEKKEENEKVTRSEFHYGSFQRSFTLPETANAEKVNASYKDGVLSITIGKKEEEKAKVKKEIVVS